MPYDTSAAAGQTPSGRHARGEMWKKRSEDAFAIQRVHANRWQRIAEVFDPDQSDFLGERSEDFDARADHYTSEPERLRRDMANRIGSMTRPKGVEWFKLAAFPEDLMKVQAVKQWCSDVTERQRNAIYMPGAGFAREMALSDSDYVTYGNAVMRMTYNDRRTGLLYTCAKLRDCAWSENSERIVNEMYERLNPMLQQAAQLFGLDNLPKEWRKRFEKNPFEKVKIVRCVVPMEDDQFDKREKPRQGMRFLSAYYACDTRKEEHGLGEGFFEVFPYSVRRWINRIGSAYARSPCTDLALSDGRTLNSAERAALQGIEWTADPPRVAPDDAFIGEISLHAGRVNFFDDKEGKRSAEDILAALPSGEPKTALEYVALKEQKLGRVFFEHLLRMPEREMTAQEFMERLESALRDAAPVFEPIEADYATLMDATFDRMLRAFGPARPWGAFDQPPDELNPDGGAQTRFNFLTALHQAQAKLKRTQAMEVTAQYIQLREIGDESADYINMDAVQKTSLLDFDPDWTLSDEEVAARRQQRAEAQQAAQQQEQAQAALEVGLKAKPENVRMMDEAMKDQGGNVVPMRRA